MSTHENTPANGVSSAASARKRMKHAAKDLEKAVVEQLRVIAQLQANLNALDRSLDGVGASMAHAHDSLGATVASISQK